MQGVTSPRPLAYPLPIWQGESPGFVQYVRLWWVRPVTLGIPKGGTRKLVALWGLFARRSVVRDGRGVDFQKAVPEIVLGDAQDFGNFAND